MPDLAGRIGALTGWRRLALAAAMGVALALAHTPFGIWPMAFIAGPVLYRLWRRGGGFRVGWVAGAAFFAVTLHWIVEPFLIDAPRYGWMAPFALMLMAGGLALFWGTAFWLAGRVRKAGPAALAVAWGGAEALRGGVFTGFPWVLPSYIWVDTPVAQMSAIIGPYGLSLITLFVMLVLGARPLRWTSGIVLVTVLLAWIWGDLRAGAWAEKSAGASGGEPQMLVRIIQPNIPQSQKWDPAYGRLNFDKALLLTGAAPKAERVPTVIIWPEVAVSFAIESAEQARTEIAIAAGGVPTILGSLAQSPRTNRWRNALFGLSGTGDLAARYDKSHLVPFGEYMPYGEVLQSLGIASLAGRGHGMEAGEPPRALAFGDVPPFTPLICYEGVFPREVRAGAADAEWIVLITNDAWFGQWAGPAQHLDHARMRAIETGLPVARAANTGISAMISPYGEVRERLPLGVEGYLDVELQNSIPGTPYMQFGAVLPVTLSFLVLMIALLQFAFARKHR